MPHVIVADDHPLCREATAMAVGAIDGAATIVATGTLAETLGALDGGSPPADLLVLDLSLPDAEGLDALAAVTGAGARTVLVVSSRDGLDVQKLVQSMGAQGFVSKAAPLSEIVEAVRTVLGGGQWYDARLASMAASPLADRMARLTTLTPAQLRVLRAMGGGRLNKQIAHDLGLSEVTVKAHVKQILKKLAVVNRTQAVLEAQALDAL